MEQPRRAPDPSSPGRRPDPVAGPREPGHLGRRLLLAGGLTTLGAAMIDNPTVRLFVNNGWPEPASGTQHMNWEHVRDVEAYSRQAALWDSQLSIDPRTSLSYLAFAFHQLRMSGPIEVRRAYCRRVGELAGRVAYQLFDMRWDRFARQCNLLTMRCGEALPGADGDSLKLRATLTEVRILTEAGRHDVAMGLVAGLHERSGLAPLERALCASVEARAVAAGTGSVKRTQRLVGHANDYHEQARTHGYDNAPGPFRHHRDTMHKADTGHALAEAAVHDPERPHKAAGKQAVKLLFEAMHAPDATPVSKVFCAAMGGIAAYAIDDDEGRGNAYNQRAGDFAKDVRSQRARDLLDRMYRAA